MVALGPHRRVRPALAAACILLPGAVTRLPANSLTWVGSAPLGLWSDSSNWNPAVPPAPADDILIAPALPVTSSLDYTPAGPLGTLTLDSATLVHTSASPLSADTEIIGSSANATYSHSSPATNAATNLSLARSPGSAGTYVLANPAALLSTIGESLGDSGSGTFVHSAGSHTSAYLYQAFGYNSSSSYTLAGPQSSLRAATEYVGVFGTASFTQSDASTHLVTSMLYIADAAGSSGAYTLSGGSLAAPYEFVGLSGDASFSQSGGTHALSSALYLAQAASSTATYSLTGGALTSPVVVLGGSGHATLSHSGGALLPSTALFLGYNPAGVANLSLSRTALLSAATEHIAYDGAATVTQTGGTHTVSASLVLASHLTATATYSLSAGSLLAHAESLAAAGHANFIQTGGTHAVATDLALAPSPTSAATYTLIGGTLTAANLYLGGNPGTPAGGPAALLATGGAISVQGTIALRPTPGTSLTLAGTTSVTAGTLAIAAPATVDLTTAPLTLTNSTPASVRSLLAAGVLTSSASDADHAIGYAPSGSSLLLELTLTGDANLDAKLDPDDFALLDKGYATAASTWWLGDFNYDGTVTPADYLLLDATYAKQAGPLSPALLAQRESQFGPGYMSNLLASIPEPSSLFLLTTGYCLLSPPPAAAARRCNSRLPPA